MLDAEDQLGRGQDSATQRSLEYREARGLSAIRAAADQACALLARAYGEESAGDARQALSTRQQALTILYRSLKTWLLRYFHRYIHDMAEAEDLTQLTFERLFLHGHSVRRNAFALVCRVRRSELLEHFKRRGAKKRSLGTGPKMRGQAEVLLDDEAWLEVLEAWAGELPSVELVDCVQRKWVNLGEAAPAKAELLELHFLGFTAREMASVLLLKPELEVSAHEEGAVRDRLYHARNAAQLLFAECKD